MSIRSGAARMAWILLILGLSLGLGSPGHSEVVEAPPPPEGTIAGFTKADIERDLVLEVKRLSPEVVQPGEAISLEVNLTNRSTDKVYPVVKPGDGSEVGWREPHVFYTAWRDKGNNQWERVPEARYVRPAQFDARWQENVVQLGAGRTITVFCCYHPHHKIVVEKRPTETVPLKRWVPSPDAMLELQQPGRVRLHVHYAYRGGNVGKLGAEGKNFDRGKMLGIPAFEIVSKPVEFEVVRPLDVVVKVHKPLKAGTKTRLSEILDVRLVNRSKGTVEVQAPTLAGDARLHFEVQGDSIRPPALEKQDQPYGKTALLGPGEEAGILGDAAMSNGLDGTWQAPQPAAVKLRAVYQASTWKPGAVIKSDWVEVKVVP